MGETEVFTIGKVLRLLPKVLGQESISLWLGFTGFATLLSLLQITLLWPPGDVGLGSALTSWVFSIAIFVASTLVQCAAIHAADSRLTGAPEAAIEALRAGFACFWAYLGLSLLLGFAVGFGFALLIVPGLFIFVVFSLAMPALIIRRTGIFKSLGVSWQMTKGYRLRILGLGCVFAATSLLAITAVFVLAAAVLYFLEIGGSIGPFLVVLVLNILLTGLSIVVVGAIASTTFRLIEADTACKLSDVSAADEPGGYRR